MSGTIEKFQACSLEESSGIDEIEGIKFINYRDESQLDSVMRLVGRDLSEPYSGKLSLFICPSKIIAVSAIISRIVSCHFPTAITIHYLLCFVVQT